MVRVCHVEPLSKIKYDQNHLSVSDTGKAFYRIVGKDAMFLQNYKKDLFAPFQLARLPMWLVGREGKVLISANQQKSGRPFLAT